MIRSMATRWSDADIAATLNRMRMPTGQGKTWTAHRVSSIRRVSGIHAYRSAEKHGVWLTMSEAAQHWGLRIHRIRRLIQAGVFPLSRLYPARRTKSEPTTSKANGCVRRWGEKVARVASTQKIKFQCLQTLDERAHNEPSHRDTS